MSGAAIESKAAAIVPNFATFHRDADRYDVYAHHRGLPPIYDRVTGGYVVLDPDQIQEMLARKDLEAVSADLAPLGERFDMDVDDINQMASHIPLTLNGEPHAESRRKLAIYLASRRPAFREWLEHSVPRHLEPFLRPGRFDAMNESIVPMFIEMMEVFLGHKLPPGQQFDWVSMLLDTHISITKRHRVYAELRELQAHIAEVVGGDPESDDVMTPMTAIVFGREPQVGSFGSTIYALISDNPGKRLDELPYAGSLHATGIPFIVRRATTTFEFHGETIEAGMILKLYLQSIEIMNDPQQLPRLFGSGPHLCPGRSFSTETWKRLVEVFKTSPMRARVLNYELVDANYLFNRPSVMELELTP